MKLLSSIVVITLTLLTPLAPDLYAGETKIILASDIWPPYTYRADRKYRGYAVDLAVEIFALQGITVEYRVMSWESAIKDVRSGKIDGIIAATVNDAPDFVFPHEPVLVTRNTFWTRTGDKWVFTGIKSLAAKRLGLVRSYNYGNKLNTYANEHKKNERKIMFTSDSDPLRTNINRLIKGEVDVIVDNYETIVSEAKLIGAFEEIRLAGEDLSLQYCQYSFQ